jgi:hypothetical protein
MRLASDYHSCGMRDGNGVRDFDAVVVSVLGCAVGFNVFYIPCCSKSERNEQQHVRKSNY